jgi:chromosomal replication initiator protein
MRTVSEITRELLRDFVKKQNPIIEEEELTPETILKAICDYYQLDIEEVQKNTRKRHVVKCRQIAHYFSRKKTDFMLKEIGYVIGNRDHATVLHSIQSVMNQVKTDKQFAKEVAEIGKLL